MGWQLNGLGVQRKIEKRQQESYLVGVIVGLNKALEIIKE